MKHIQPIALRAAHLMVAGGLLGLMACRSSSPGETAETAATPIGWSAQSDADPDDHIAIAASLTPRLPGDLSLCTLAVTLTFEPGWHGYASLSRPGGLRETTIGLRLPEGVETVGPWERPDGVPSKDDEETSIYEGVVTFTRDLELPEQPNGSIEVDVDFQVCNESFCLPPNSVPLVLELGAGVEVSTALVEETGEGSAGAADSAAQAQIEALLAEHESSELGYVEAYQAFRPRFEVFAAEHRGTESEVTALLWLMRGTWWLRSDGMMETTSEPIMDDLLARHASSPQLATVPESYYVFSKGKRVQVLSRLLESPHAEVRAAVQLRQALGALRGTGPESAALLRESCSALTLEFADLPFHETTYGAMAEACLGRHTSEELEIGQKAPDIRGEDVDGVSFALSDYEGKVVLLDFWGDW